MTGMLAALALGWLAPELLPAFIVLLLAVLVILIGLHWVYDKVYWKLYSRKLLKRNAATPLDENMDRVVKRVMKRFNEDRVSGVEQRELSPDRKAYIEKLTRDSFKKWAADQKQKRGRNGM